ncbi:regulator of chromosome condensation 1/beta-lactamase-inhibitor protein II [Gilbertella persicaria]|uniref:regulator of chromosome condensation 1/beta-lactamase-inhibitor protein II n=1 Tax=Gilbertella persicaria TaxID=101096 RepID=UPI00221E74FF|nr:regulator of chromosome condensation 1/beta-lactamase-inhibitor protein II [Gilbertella persicaria]KAI8073448.1 regulator of chromosome condensation 1/beta-lactamase-inhibitor protein II [Gilbertella persicaria]
MSKLYAFGSNGQGQLGVGHIEDLNTPTPCIGIPENEAIKKISSGGNHTAIVTTHGHLYMTGMSQRGEGPMKTLRQEWTVFQRRFTDHVWKDVSCGWAFTLMLTTHGTLFGTGTSRWHELTGPSTEELVEIKGLKSIESVACGWRHAVALDKEGNVYGWGWGKHNQLGPLTTTPIDKKKDIRDIQKIAMPQPIVQVACGHLHTLLLGKDGTVYAFGSNKYGQLDNVPPKAIWIDAGWHHNAALLNKQGDLVLWGRNDHYQLSKYPSLQDVKQVACGSEHTLIIRAKDEQVLAWGWNEHGNCTSSQDDVHDPLTVLTEKASLVAAGCATSWIIVTV